MSEKLYSIQEQTLTDIADAIRGYYGETKLGPAVVEEPIVKVLNTSGATSFDVLPSARASLNTCYPVRIENAATLKVRFTHKINFDPNYPVMYPKLQFAAGYYTTNTDFPTNDVPIYAKTSTEIVELTFEGDAVTMFVMAASMSSETAYYVEITGYDADGNPVVGPMEKETEVANTYKPGEMGAAISGILAHFGIQPVVLSGNCSRACSGSLAGLYFEAFGDMVSTSDVTDVNYMFDGFTGETIPFDINMKSTSHQNFQNCFGRCFNLKQLPVFTGAYPNGMGDLFADCRSLRNIPDDYMDDWNFERMNTHAYSSMSGMFKNCYSLRSISPNILSKLRNPTATSSSYKPYYNMFNCCYALDEVIGLAVDTSTQTSNLFSYTFSDCARLKNMIFETNEDGSAKIANWKSQAIDLSQAGFPRNSNENYVLQHNSGIPYWKYVYDEISYQKLKDDAEWYCRSTTYSRYNHNSAVATINSLPDTSAYLATAGGTNTIKFKGAAGSATDGGAINTLTAEEIAVATARGWTVTLV